MVEEVVVGVIVAGVAALSVRSAYKSFKRGGPACGCGPAGCPIAGKEDSCQKEKAGGADGTAASQDGQARP